MSIDQTQTSPKPRVANITKDPNQQVILTPSQIRALNGLFALNPDSNRVIIDQDASTTTCLLSGYKYTGTSNKYFEVEVEL